MKKLALLAVLGSIFVDSANSMSLINQISEENQTMRASEPMSPSDSSDTIEPEDQTVTSALEQEGIGRWTEDEDDRLKKAIGTKKPEEIYWPSVSYSVRTRTPQQCRMRWLYSPANPDNSAHGKWTPEEDEQLIASYNRTPHYLFSWDSVAKDVPGRHGMQCRSRWEIANPDINRGPWSPDEDKHLTEVIHKNQNQQIDWSYIASNFPDRTARQCRERWMNYINPDIKRTEWTEDEDNMIVEQVKIIGHKWTQISKQLQGRSPSQVKNRYLSVLSKRGQSDS